MNAQEPRVLIRKDPTAVPPVTVAAPGAAWAAVGWLGALLAVMALADIVLDWYPLVFQSPEWEFGTVVKSVSAMPLLTIGLAALLGSMLARGKRRGIIAVSIVLLVLAVLTLAAYGLFLTDVPLALRAKGPTALEIKKIIVRTTIMGLGFAGGYLVAAVLSLRFLFRRGR